MTHEQRVRIIARWLCSEESISLAAVCGHYLPQKEVSQMRVAAYLRRSDPGEESKNYSIENQREDVVTWAQRESHEIVTEYSDPGGRSYTLYRPIFQQMLRDAQAAKFDLVAVGRYDRFSRSQTQQSVAIHQLRELKVQVVSVTQPVPDGAIGDMMRNQYAFVAELEREYIRERTNDGKRKRIMKDKLPAAGCPRFGYRYADESRDAYVPNPETAPIVQRIFQLYVSGVSVGRICQLFDAEDVVTPSQYQYRSGYGRKRQLSAQWHRDVIRRILQDPSYIGKYVANRTRTEVVPRSNPLTGEVFLVRRILKRDSSDPLLRTLPPEVCPPLVDEAIFEQVQRMLAVGKAQSARNLRRPEKALLANGLAVCGYCGRGMVARWYKDRDAYKYNCGEMHGTVAGRQPRCTAPYNFSVSAPKLDAAAWDWLTNQLRHPERMREFYEEYVRQAGKHTKAHEARRQGALNAVAEAKREEESFLDAIGKADANYRDVLLARAQAAHDRVRAQEESLEEVERLLAGQERNLALLESFTEVAQRASGNLVDATPEDKRLALRIYDVKVHVYENTHTPPYRCTWLGGIDPTIYDADQ